MRSRTAAKLAAAIRCGAGVIVTFNEAAFPRAALEPFGIEAQHPDQFAEFLFDLGPAAVIAAAQRQRSKLKAPTMDVDQSPTGRGMGRSFRV